MEIRGASPFFDLLGLSQKEKREWIDSGLAPQKACARLKRKALRNKVSQMQDNSQRK
jgi:hypothetical protein